MKQKCLFVALALLFIAPTSCSQQSIEPYSTDLTESECNNTFNNKFVQGLTTGFAAGLTIDFVRAYMLPDITNWDLYGRFCICRDQLTGQAKMALALVGGVLCNQDTANQCTKTACKWSGQILGVIAGSLAASYMKKIAAAKFFQAAPANPIVQPAPGPTN